MKTLINFKWLIELAKTNPLVFSVTILLIAVSGLVTAVIDRDRKITNCNADKVIMQNKFEQRMDSVTAYYRLREAQLTLEVKETLKSVIDDYKNQLEEQRKINSTINSTINKNKSILKKTNDQIKNLTDDK